MTAPAVIPAERVFFSPKEVHGITGFSLPYIYEHWEEMGGAKHGESRNAPIRFTMEALLEYHRSHLPETAVGGRRPRATHEPESRHSNLAHIRRFAAKKRQG